MNKLSSIFFLFLLFSCSSQPDEVEVFNKLQEASDLATTEFVVSKIISATKSKAVFGIKLTNDATFLAESEATIEAGVDLSKLKQEDIQITEKNISIILPAVEILHFSYPPEKIKPIEELSRGNVFNDFSAKEKEALYRDAELAIKANLKALEIEKTTEQNTKKLFSHLLRKMGFETVEITFR